MMAGRWTRLGGTIHRKGRPLNIRISWSPGGYVSGMLGHGIFFLVLPEGLAQFPAAMAFVKGPFYNELMFFKERAFSVV
jgi:hypothetical protein